MIQRRGSAKLLHSTRVAWLRPRIAQYQNVPGLNQDVSDAGRAALEVLRADMNVAGLLKGASYDGQRETIRRLVSELRGEKIQTVAW